MTVHLNIFSRPQVIENSRQYSLLLTGILKKTVVGCPCPLASHLAWLIKCVLCRLDSYSRTITSGSMFTLIFATQMSYSLLIKQERSTAGLWHVVYRNKNEQTRQISGRIKNASRSFSSFVRCHTLNIQLNFFL